MEYIVTFTAKSGHIGFYGDVDGPGFLSKRVHAKRFASQVHALQEIAALLEDGTLEIGKDETIAVETAE